MDNTPYVVSFRMVFFYLMTTGWIFYIPCVRIQSINQKVLLYTISLSVEHGLADVWWDRTIEPVSRDKFLGANGGREIRLSCPAAPGWQSYPVVPNLLNMATHPNNTMYTQHTTDIWAKGVTLHKHEFKT